MFQGLEALLDEFVRATSGDRFDTAHTCRRRAFADDDERTYIRCTFEVCTTAQLVGVFVFIIFHDGNSADGLTIFFTEERHRAFLLGFIERLGHLDHGHVHCHGFVDHALDTFDLVGGHGFGVVEIETQMSRRDQ